MFLSRIWSTAVGSSIPTAFGELPIVDDEGKLVENFTASAEPTEVYSVLRSKLTIERLPPFHGEVPQAVQTAGETGESLRLVMISDTHGKHRALTDLPAGDVLVHAGDFTSRGGLEEVQDFVEWMCSLPYEHKLVIAGNHELSLDTDWCDGQGNSSKAEAHSAEALAALRSCPGINFLEHASVNIGGYEFFGSPYQPAFCGWAFNVPRGAQCNAKWSAIPDDTDVLITHGPPLGHGDACFMGKRAGCLDLLRHIQNRIKPKLHIFGHIHEDYGTTTDGVTFINASTCNLRYRPNNRPLVFDLPRKGAMCK
jgi:predicted phosphodiesterase